MRKSGVRFPPAALQSPHQDGMTNYSPLNQREMRFLLGLVSLEPLPTPKGGGPKGFFVVPALTTPRGSGPLGAFTEPAGTTPRGGGPNGPFVVPAFTTPRGGGPSGDLLVPVSTTPIGSGFDVCGEEPFAPLFLFMWRTVTLPFLSARGVGVSSLMRIRLANDAKPRSS